MGLNCLLQVCTCWSRLCLHLIFRKQLMLIVFCFPVLAWNTTIIFIVIKFKLASEAKQVISVHTQCTEYVMTHIASHSGKIVVQFYQAITFHYGGRCLSQLPSEHNNVHNSTPFLDLATQSGWLILKCVPESILPGGSRCVDSWTDTVIRILRQEGCVDKTEEMTKWLNHRKTFWCQDGITAVVWIGTPLANAAFSIWCNLPIHF